LFDWVLPRGGTGTPRLGWDGCVTLRLLRVVFIGGRAPILFARGGIGCGFFGGAPCGCTGRGTVCTGRAFGAGIIGRALGGGTGADTGRGFAWGGRACGVTGRALGGGLT